MEINTEKYSDEEIIYIVSLKEERDKSWAEITEAYNNKFNKTRSLESVRKGYERNRDRLSDTNEYVKVLRDVARTRKANSLNAKDLRKTIESIEAREHITDAIKAATMELNKLVEKSPIKLPKSKKDKKSMTLELLISDVHVGKLTKTYNLDVLKRRLKQISDTTIKEMERASEYYKIDRIILAFIGDLIESATMHGTESSKGCEFGNSRQIQEALTNLFYLLFLPISIAASKLGAKIDAVGITGNHDRTETERTFSNVGEDNVTWIIYKAMEEFTKLSGLKNVTWSIPVEPYQYLEIYEEGVLYEHYDNAKGANQRVAIEGLLSKRVNQLKKSIIFIRGGHFHEPMECGIGKIVINGNVPGNDGYSTIHGFDCEPSQTLNFYIKRDKNDSIKRQTSFYKRFLIQLN